MANYRSWSVCSECEPDFAFPGVPSVGLTSFWRTTFYLRSLDSNRAMLTKHVRNHGTSPLTSPYGCQYFPSQLLYSRYSLVQSRYRGCPCVAMAVMFVRLVSSTCSHWPLPFAPQPPLPFSRASDAAPFDQALLAVREESGREPSPSPSAELHSAEKRYRFSASCWYVDPGSLQNTNPRARYVPFAALGVQTAPGIYTTLSVRISSWNYLRQVNNDKGGRGGEEIGPFTHAIFHAILRTKPVPTPHGFLVA